MQEVSQQCQLENLSSRFTDSAASQPAGRWFVSVLLGTPMAALGIATYLPMALVLPALSIVMVVSGFAIAAILYLAGCRMSTGFSPAWEVVGALVFLGFAAAILSDSREALALLDEMETTGRAALAR